MAPAPTMFNASIALVNQIGKSASRKRTSPAMPVSRKTTTKTPNHRIARRTSRKTRAPSGARIPQSPTPPDGRNPPTNICPTAVMRRMSRSWMTRRSAEAAGPREEHQRADRDGEVDERKHANPRAEGEVDSSPYHRHGQDQHREQHEEGLLVAEVLVVLGIRAEPGEPCRRVVNPRTACSGAGPGLRLRLLGHAFGRPRVRVSSTSTGASSRVLPGDGKRVRAASTAGSQVETGSRSRCARRPPQ